MSGVRNMSRGIASVAAFRAAVRELPLRLRAAVAKDGEGILTRKVREDFDGGRTAYGLARPLSTEGKALDLMRTGAARASLAFTAVGTILRASLGPRYSKYLVGKYAVLPQSLPVAWRVELEQLVADYRQVWAEEVSR